MGLDSYWVKPTAPGQFAVPVDLGRKINLIGGLFSGNGGDGSFRGKCYDWFVEEVGKLSLYEHMQPPEVCQVAAINMRRFYEDNKHRPLAAPEEMAGNEEWQAFKNWKEVEDFIVMFEKYSEAGYFLDGWW